MPCCIAIAEEVDWRKDLPVVEYKDEEGKEYCVFHTPVGKKGISAKEFNELIFERINFDIRKKQLCDLSGTIFEWDISFDKFNEDDPLPPVDFTDATFNGKADFTGTAFSGEAGFFGDNIQWKGRF